MIRDNTTIGEKWPRPSDNPFVRENGKIRSPTAIANLISTNRQRAVELCRAAGEPLDRWFPNHPQ